MPPWRCQKALASKWAPRIYSDHAVTPQPAPPGEAEGPEDDRWSSCSSSPDRPHEAAQAGAWSSAEPPPPLLPSTSPMRGGEGLEPGVPESTVHRGARLLRARTLISNDSPVGLLPRAGSCACLDTNPPLLPLQARCSAPGVGSVAVHFGFEVMAPPAASSTSCRLAGGSSASCSPLARSSRATACDQFATASDPLGGPEPSGCLECGPACVAAAAAGAQDAHGPCSTGCCSRCGGAGRAKQPCTAALSSVLELEARGSSGSSCHNSSSTFAGHGQHAIASCAAASCVCARVAPRRDVGGDAAPTALQPRPPAQQLAVLQPCSTPCKAVSRQESSACSATGAVSCGSSGRSVVGAVCHESAPASANPSAHCTLSACHGLHCSSGGLISRAMLRCQSEDASPAGSVHGKAEGSGAGAGSGRGAGGAAGASRTVQPICPSGAGGIDALLPRMFKVKVWTAGALDYLGGDI